LEEVVGLGPEAGALLWEAAAQEGETTEPDVVDAFAELAANGDLAAALDALAVTRVLTGANHTDAGLDDAAGWGDLEAIRHQPWLGGINTERELTHLDVTGQWFTVIEHEAAPFRVSVTIDRGAASTVLIGLMDGEATIDSAALGIEAWDRVFVAVSRLPPDGWDGDDDPEVPTRIIARISVSENPPLDSPDFDYDPDGGGSACSCAGACGGGSAAALVPAFLLVPTRRRRSKAERRTPRG
jgi:hypothetical protein